MRERWGGVRWHLDRSTQRNKVSRLGSRCRNKKQGKKGRREKREG